MMKKRLTEKPMIHEGSRLENVKLGAYTEVG